MTNTSAVPMYVSSSQRAPLLSVRHVLTWWLSICLRAAGPCCCAAYAGTSLPAASRLNLMMSAQRFGVICHRIQVSHSQYSPQHGTVGTAKLAQAGAPSSALLGSDCQRMNEVDPSRAHAPAQWLVWGHTHALGVHLLRCCKLTSEPDQEARLPRRPRTASRLELVQARYKKASMKASRHIHSTYRQTFFTWRRTTLRRPLPLGGALAVACDLAPACPAIIPGLVRLISTLQRGREGCKLCLHAS